MILVVLITFYWLRVILMALRRLKSILRLSLWSKTWALILSWD